jgi:hypothetical protein
MAQFIPPIAAFAGLRSLGVMAGGIIHINVFAKKLILSYIDFNLTTHC